MTWDPNDPRMLSRSEDPDTSKTAAVAISPYLKGERERAWNLLLNNQNSTASELAALAQDRDVRKVGRRLSELERLGFVIRNGVKNCRITGRECTMWLARFRQGSPVNRPTKRDKIKIAVDQAFSDAARDAANKTPTLAEEQRLKAVLDKLKAAVMKIL